MSSGSSIPTDQSLSPEDAQVLWGYGRDITQDAVGFIWETLFMSAYGIFFALAVYSIALKGIKSRSSFIMLFVVVYLYASSLTLWGLNITWWFKKAHVFFMDYPDMPLADRRERAYEDLDKIKIGTVMEALFMFNMIVGDSVVIWRAWVLYPNQLWAVSIPCLMLTMSFIFSIIDITCLTGAAFTTQTSIAGGGPVCERAELIAWAFSLFTNASCTVLIGIRAWSHRRSIRSLHISHHSAMPANRILSLLVESGFIYCLFWLTQLILFFDVNRLNGEIYAYQLFAGMGDQISGMYPTLIIVIVNFHKTIWELKHPDGTTTGVGGGGSIHFSDTKKYNSRTTGTTGTTGTFPSTMPGHRIELGESDRDVELHDVSQESSPTEYKKYVM